MGQKGEGVWLVKQPLMQLWGWERSFFEELQSLLQTADRETSNANIAFCEYVVERIGMTIVSCFYFN